MLNSTQMTPENRTLLHKGEYTELTLYLGPGNKSFVRKTSPHLGSQKLRQEVKFISEILPQAARKYFPEIIGQTNDYKPGDAYYYDMPYYPGMSLRRKIFNDCGSVTSAVNEIENIFKVLKEILFNAKSLETPHFFKDKYYFKRVSSRLSKYARANNEYLPISGTVDSLTRAQLENFFSNVVHRPIIYINGKELLTPLEILRKLSVHHKLSNLILPSEHSMCLIHGDPHLGNIFIKDIDSLPLFFDPNGFQTGGDMAYDLGKFILSLDYLDLLLEKKLSSPHVEMNNEYIQVSDLWHSGDKDRVARVQSILQIIVKDVLSQVFAANISKDPLLIERSSFVANLHAFSCAHTFIPTINKNVALPLLLRFILRANEHLEIIERSKGKYSLN